VTKRSIQDGDSLTLSAIDVLRLGQLANNSTRLPDAWRIQASTSGTAIRELVGVLLSIDLKSRDTVVFTAVIDKDDSLGEIVMEGNTARCYISLCVARDWALMATATIDFLGDPEAGTVTGYSTSELAESADLLAAHGWDRR